MGFLNSKINIVQILSIILAILQETEIVSLIPKQYVWIVLIAVNVLTIVIRTFMSNTLPPSNCKERQKINNTAPKSLTKNPKEK